MDWVHRESARARLRVLVKRILRKYGYPPDLQDAVVYTVIQQAEAQHDGRTCSPSPLRTVLANNERAEGSPRELSDGTHFSTACARQPLPN